MNKITYSAFLCLYLKYLSIYSDGLFTLSRLKDHCNITDLYTTSIRHDALLRCTYL